jgi:hypothetical protein
VRDGLQERIAQLDRERPGRGQDGIELGIGQADGRHGAPRLLASAPVWRVYRLGLPGPIGRLFRPDPPDYPCPEKTHGPPPASQSDPILLGVRGWQEAIRTGSACARLSARCRCRGWWQTSCTQAQSRAGAGQQCGAAEACIKHCLRPLIQSGTVALERGKS